MRLRTFGGLWITADPPAPALGPRRMALLALVAAAGKRGISRERILGILWSDTAEDQARHTLSQNLYTLRRETGREWIVASPELRLDPSATADVTEFAEALAVGDLDRAVELYSGAFLEGFYLPGAPEFERWVEEERARLRAKALHALETLAAKAGQTGLVSEAIARWRRLAEIDPLSARYTVGLMNTLVAAGDQPAALAQGRRHEETVRRELGTEVDPAVRRLVDGLRVAPKSVHSASPAITTAAPSPRPAAPVSRRRGLIVAAAVAAVVVVALAGWLIARPRPDPNGPPFLAVGTIRADSATPGGVLRDMLATNLGNIGGLRVVSNSRLLELIPRGSDSNRTATTDAARRAGATEVIEGELLGAGPELVLTLRRVALATGVVKRRG